MLLELGLIWGLKSVTLADTPLAKELTISQIKITGDEFIVLHNATASNLQLGNFWLQYFNDFNLSNAGISNSSSQLPQVTLQPGQEMLLSLGTAASCGPVWVSKLSFSLKDTAGMLQVLGLSQTSGIIGYKPEDQVSWSSKSTDSVDIKPVSSSSSSQIWYKPASSWLSTATPLGCSAVGGSTSSSTNTPDTLTRSTTSPPSVVLNQVEENTQTNIPAADAGLMAPELSEILPNPGSPKTDANDEYVELYNPNDRLFDLGGFIMKAGSSSTYTYVFPVGQFILQPHEFKSFYSSTTDLSLSNSDGKVQLYSPDAELLSESDTYSDAKDDYGWILADGLWQWTSISTPNARNAIAATSNSQNTLDGGHPALPEATILTKTYPLIQISELFPNPKSPQTDAEDEFIELYNPNKQPVDLTGYQIVTGANGSHKYKFKGGSIGPKSYKSFNSSSTSISLSNSSGKAMLLAPNGATMDATGEYDKAPDGDTWIYAGGKWQWTILPTPGKANVLVKPVVKAAVSSSLGRPTSAGSGPGSQSAGASQAASNKLPVHPLVLAAVGIPVLLYALYEYRHDMANQLYRLRRNRKVGRGDGQATETATSFRTLL